MRRALLRKLLSIALMAIALVAIVFSHPAQAADISSGEKIFNANCSACHIGGNNIIIANKTLKKEALEKYGMDSLEAIEKQVTNGKNAMPAFRGRLTQDQIEDVATYVLGQSQKGW